MILESRVLTLVHVGYLFGWIFLSTNSLHAPFSALYCPQTAAVQEVFHNRAASGARRATRMALGQPYLWTMVCFLSRLCNISAMAVTFCLVRQLGGWTSSSACIYLGTGWQTHRRSHFSNSSPRAFTTSEWHDSPPSKGQRTADPMMSPMMYPMKCNTLLAMTGSL